VTSTPEPLLLDHITRRYEVVRTPLLELRQVSKQFGDVVAVDDVSLTIATGEFITLLGASGSGKTTTLRMIAGFEHPGAGEILDVVLDPDDWQTAYVIDSQKVYQTTDAGANWDVISDELHAIDLKSLEIVKTPGGDKVLLVGASQGVYRAINPVVDVQWTELGSGLPNALVRDIDFANRLGATDDVLLAGTMGRGAWTLAGDADTVLELESQIVIGGTSGDDVIRIGQTAAGRTDGRPQGQLYVNFNGSDIFAPWRSDPTVEHPLGVPLVEQIRISGLVGDDDIAALHGIGFVLADENRVLGGLANQPRFAAQVAVRLGAFAGHQYLRVHPNRKFFRFDTDHGAHPGHTLRADGDDLARAHQAAVDTVPFPMRRGLALTRRRAPVAFQPRAYEMMLAEKSLQIFMGRADVNHNLTSKTFKKFKPFKSFKSSHRICPGNGVLAYSVDQRLWQGRCQTHQTFAA